MLYYSIPFSTMNQLGRSDIVIHNMNGPDPIPYHSDAIHFIPLNFFLEVRYLLSMGLDPELLRRKKRRMRLWK